jgi:hypothetical protein
MKKIFMIMFVVMMFATSAFAEVVNDSNYITVTEYGLPNANDTAIGAKKLHARRAAIINGYKALLEEAKSVSIDGTATVADLAFVSEITNARVEGAVNGAKVIAEEWNAADETFKVTLRMSIFGLDNSLAKAVLTPNANKETFATAAEYTNVVNVEKPVVSGGYSGVVVDARGFNLPTAMSPVIYDANMNPIYGYKNLDYDYVVANGMVGYTRDITDHNRAGSTPLVVKAIGVKGASPIVSNEDATKILAENEKSGFLSDTRVVFVR